MSKNDKTPERINYFDGLRLGAELLRTEQEYHLQMQRLLVGLLARPGILRGFLVRNAGSKDNHAMVEIMPGLAADPEGHLIVLGEPRTQRVEGRFLYVHYAERRIAFASSAGCSGAPNEPQPSLLRCEPEFAWRNNPQGANPRWVLLATITVDANCTLVESIAPAASAADVSTGYTQVLCKEKDVNHENPLKIHIYNDRALSRVRIAIRGEKFSSLFYSEMGRHKHAVSHQATTEGEDAISVTLQEHRHAISQHAAASQSIDAFHFHTLEIRNTQNTQWDRLPFVKAVTDPTGNIPGIRVRGASPTIQGDPQHLKTDGTTVEPPPAFTGSLQSVRMSGQTKRFPSSDARPDARSGTGYTFAGDVRIKVSALDITESVAMRAGVGNTLGDADPPEAFAAGPVRIDDLDLLAENQIDLSQPGTYEIEISVGVSVDNNSGGCIHCYVFLDP